MDLMMSLATVFASLNVAVLVGLLYLYIRIAWQSKAVYPIGLAIFASLLLLQNGVTAFSYLAMAPIFGEAGPYLFFISVLEFGGLLALVRVTL
jgi:hypothetical protein